MEPSPRRWETRKYRGLAGPDGMKQLLRDGHQFAGADLLPGLAQHHFDGAGKEKDRGRIGRRVRWNLDTTGEGHQHELGVVLEIQEGEGGPLAFGHGERVAQVGDGNHGVLLEGTKVD